jgi:hypothetical protein
VSGHNAAFSPNSCWRLRSRRAVRPILVLLVAIAGSSCQTNPACFLATPEEGWRILQEPPPPDVQSWSVLPGADLNNWVWVRHEHGGYGQCLRKNGDKYCSGLFWILSPDPDEVVLIKGANKCH